ncbi:WG repeat protein [Natranaerovirga pectinivora]|uniref:WG repeat protein n=1 Tax=Natranaerovirga pectinivora TaxID=682400 RepID=A0A4R3MMX0_9FIRM|nr:WG repeat-containing protein [Natranaerovirga pectinivora]TCT13942.1 WG repeat protein [Natranaerovirga pectinivora]
MKKLIVTLMMIFLLVLTTKPLLAREEVSFEIKINGQILNIPKGMGAPFIDISSRTQIPARAIIEGLGYVVLWNNDTQTIAILDKKDNLKATLVIGSRLVKLSGGEIIEMDTEAILGSDGRTYVPLRFVSQALGFLIPDDGYAFKDGVHKIDLINSEEINKLSVVLNEKPLYKVWESFFNGRRYVSRYSFMDNQGNIVIEPKEFRDVNNFREGLAVVTYDRRSYGYINTVGDMVIEPNFFRAFDFFEGFARVILFEDRHGIIDKEGSIVFAFDNRSSSIISDFKNGLALARINGEYVFINTAGEIVVRPEIKANDADNFSEDLALIKNYSGWGFINKKGKVIIPLQYLFAKNFSEGIAAVQDKNSKKWGYINKQGDYIIEPKYYEAETFSEGLALVNIGERFNNYYVFIDREGNYIVDLYKVIENIHKEFSDTWIYDVTNFSEGFVAVSYRTYIPNVIGPVSNTSYIDQKGNILTTIYHGHGQLGYGHEFRDGIAEVGNYYINNTGKIIKKW